MLIEVGHENADGLVVTQTRLSDDLNDGGEPVCSYVVGSDAQEVRNHLFDNPGMVTHLPGNTAVLETVNPIRDRAARPIWVAVLAEQRDPAVAEDFERFLADFWSCSRGKPADIEETHWTLHDGNVFAPGDAPQGE